MQFSEDSQDKWVPRSPALHFGRYRRARPSTNERPRPPAEERPHQGLENRLIEPAAEAANDAGPIRCRERLGGLLRYYYRDAA